MPQALAELARWYAEGKVKPVIDQRLPMQRAARGLCAHGQPQGARQAGDDQRLSKRAGRDGRGISHERRGAPAGRR